MQILIVNPGSESRKYALYSDTRELWSVHIENNHERLTEEQLADCQPDVIAFRIVAPGDFFQSHRPVDPEYLQTLARARSRAPLHIDPVLAEIEFFQARFPASRLFAVSDSAFHRTLPDHARVYALPFSDTTDLELARFGYHGISLASIVRTLRERGAVPRRVVACHLGGGSSITALRAGESVDTSMGFSPLAGLPMATRAGDLDPGALSYLAEAKDLHGEQLTQYLAQESGFLGVAGTADMRELLARELAGDERAALAIRLFVYQIRKFIGAYRAVLGGLDLLVFSGTIGERSEPIRSKVLEGLDLAGAGVEVIASNEMAEMASIVCEELQTQ